MSETTTESLVRLMVGRDVHDAFPKIQVDIGAPVLSVERYCHETEFRDISFDLRKGEILGLYGLIGAGRSELCQSLFGITRPASGQVTLNGEPLVISKVGESGNYGLPINSGAAQTVFKVATK